MKPLWQSALVKQGGNTGDIHEGNHQYLVAVHDAYEELVERYQWHRIPCAIKDGASQYGLRTIEDIHNDVYQAVVNLLP